MPMISLDAALATLDHLAEECLVETEVLRVDDALGRVLAKDHVSRVDLPPFNKSAMDGYAIMADDERASYRVLEVVPAGQMPQYALEPGTAAKVMTGAPVPEGAGRVVMVEDTDRGEETVQVFEHRNKSNICGHGEDVRIGQVIGLAGKVLMAVDLANLVSCGLSEVSVRRRVRVAVLSTGDELVEAYEDLGEGKIMDSNGPMLRSLAIEHGLEPVACGRVSDDPEALAAAIEGAAAASDIVMLSGGVSAGDFDFVPGALRSSGFEIHIDSVSVKPGKPLTVATRDRQFVFGLPGNPVSVFLCFHLYVRRVAARLSGSEPPMREFAVHIRDAVRRRGGDREGFLPCALDAAGRAYVLPWHGSAHLMALSEADGFLRIPKGVTEIGAGEEAVFCSWWLGTGGRRNVSP